MRENGILRFTGFTEEIIYASFPHHCLVCSSLVNTIKEDQNSTLVSISFRFCQRVLILNPSHAVCKGEKPSDVEQRLLVFTRVRDRFYGLPCRDHWSRLMNQTWEIFASLPILQSMHLNTSEHRTLKYCFAKSFFTPVPALILPLDLFWLTWFVLWCRLSSNIFYAVVKHKILLCFLK